MAHERWAPLAWEMWPAQSSTQQPEECPQWYLLEALTMTNTLVNVLKVSKERAVECVCVGLEAYESARWAVFAPWRG
jgi:hypothetical protein